MNRDSHRLCSVAERNGLRLKERYVLIKLVRRKIERKRVNATVCLPREAWVQGGVVDSEEAVNGLKG